MGLFNRIAAAHYALKWAIDPNPKYRNYSGGNGGGGDCTNFVSQAMFAGGWTMTGGLAFDNQSWWSSQVEGSKPWASTDGFPKFMLWSERGKPCTADELTVGDVVSYTKADASSHIMLVTMRVYGPADNGVFLSYHSTNTINKSLASVRERAGKAATLTFWKIADSFYDIRPFTPRPDYKSSTFMKCASVAAQVYRWTPF